MHALTLEGLMDVCCVQRMSGGGTFYEKGLASAKAWWHETAQHDVKAESNLLWLEYRM